MKGRALAVIFLFLVRSLAAQVDAGSVIRQVRVRVAFANGPCDVSTHVTLMGRSGPLAEGNADEQCQVVFENIPAGTYHLDVSARNVPDVDAGTVTMTSTGSTDFEVKVKSDHAPEHASNTLVGPVVSAQALGVPARALKEFDRANQLIAKQDFTKAIEDLNRAIAIYPAYANAYNNLGVIYARLGDRQHEAEALQKAIGIDDHFAPAYVNLGRMNISTGDFHNAESALNKASEYDPGDAMTLVLLTYAEFMDHRLDEAVATCRKAHGLPGPHAFAHQVAARALEQKRLATDAIAELEIFLLEEPAGPRADVARKELGSLRVNSASSR